MSMRGNAISSVLLLLLPILMAPLREAVRKINKMPMQQTAGEPFSGVLNAFLSTSVSLQGQPNIYYDARDHAQFRATSSRCEPRFTYSTRSKISCDKLAILLHGFTSCPGTWYKTQPALNEAGFCVLAPTLPGHGYEPKPKAESVDTFKLTIDKHTWPKLRSVGTLGGLGFGDYWARTWDVLTGLIVEWDGDAWKVLDVKKDTMMYNFNTLVAHFETGGLDMVLPGDRISRIRPANLVQYVDSAGQLALAYRVREYATTSEEYWTNGPAFIEFKFERGAVEENLIDLPTDQTWPAYVDFARQLARLVSAFKDENPNGEIVMMGHSLGAAIATATMVHAPSMIDRVLVLNPAYGVDPKFGWALQSVGAWFPLNIGFEACQKTRNTLSVGGYCRYRTDHVLAVNSFGTYALCKLIAAGGDQKHGWSNWCKGAFSKLDPEENTTSSGPSSVPIAKDMEVVTTYLDPAIDNRLVNKAAAVAKHILGPGQVGFCYLKGDLTHNFLDELSSTSKRDFWWHDHLQSHIVTYLYNGTKFPLQSQRTHDKAEDWSLGKSIVDGTMAVAKLPFKLVQGAAHMIAPPHADERCELFHVLEV